jgi:hypothetical protein
MINFIHKNVKIIFSIFIILAIQSVSAQMPNIAFYKNKKPSLTFSTATQSLFKSNCSGATTLQTKNSAGAVTNVSANLTVNLTTPDSVVFYSDSSCITPITSVVVATGTSSISFYFISTTVGSPQINAEATNYPLVSQVETVTTNPFVWTGGGADANWATALNWSGGAVPGTSNTALFDSTCVSNCSPTIAANALVGGVRMETGYSGTITQGATRTLTISSRLWVQKAGTFQGADGAITIGTTFTQTGGTFSSTSGTLLTKSNIYQSGGTFNHRSGLLLWQTGCCNTYDFKMLSSLNNLTFNEINATINIIGTITVLGNLILNDQNPAGGNINGTGVIELWGNLTITNFSAGGNGGLIKLVGSSQTITGTAGKALSTLEIASTGTVTLVGEISIPGNFTYTSGTIVPGSSTVRFWDIKSRTINANNINLNNVIFSPTNCTLTMVGTMNVNGDLTFNDPAPSNITELVGGVINLSGNLNITSWANKFNGDTYVINIVGDNTRTQTITGVSSAYVNTLSINSASTVNLAGNVDISKDFTYTTSGAFNAGTSTLEFRGSTATNTITPGTATYNNVTFANNSINNSNTYIISGTMNIAGNLLLAQSNGGNRLNSGTLAVGGNVSMTNFNAGTAALTLNGTGIQTISRTAGTFPTGNISINKASGSVDLASAFSWNGTGQATTVATGTANMIKMNSYALTLTSLNLNGNTLTKGGGVLTVAGAVSGVGPLYSGTVAP